jgi:CheY-like chemotaxis protein/two-component sensor histidine kinase
MTTPDPISAADLARPRLLVVDDLKDNRILLTRRLRARGYEVVEAADGFEALAVIARQAFDAVLLDVVMPGMDGFQVLRAIRERHSARDLPVIMATVKDDAQDVVRALREGANDYILKPIDFAVVQARVDAHVQRKQAEACARQSQPELEGLVADLRTALAEADDAARLKANFMADLSHEIRTPLNGILGVAKAMAAAASDPWQGKMLATITESAVALERLLSDALDLSRAEAGALEIRQEPFDLAALVERCAGLFEPLAQEKGLDLQLEIEPEARVTVTGDWLRLQQILNNLISNAVKFTSRGSVRCSVMRAVSGGFRFDVQDTGVGFDAAIAPLLFDRFKQADQAVAARFGGAGLGLAISRRLARLMGGDITAQSRPQEGALFSLLLPLTVSPTDQAEPVAEIWPSSSTARLGRRGRVLLAEDHATNRLVVELMLRACNVDLVVVENGAQAVDAFCSQTFDCLLMDMEMPVMDGLSAIRGIRSHEARTGAQPVGILTLSAHATEEHRQRSAAAGADGHLTKPVHPEALLKALADIFRRRRPADDGQVSTLETAGAPWQPTGDQAVAGRS